MVWFSRKCFKIVRFRKYLLIYHTAVVYGCHIQNVHRICLHLRPNMTIYRQYYPCFFVLIYFVFTQNVQINAFLKIKFVVLQDQLFYAIMLLILMERHFVLILLVVNIQRTYLGMQHFKGRGQEYNNLQPYASSKLWLKIEM